MTLFADGAAGPGPWADHAECARLDVDMALEERSYLIVFANNGAP